MDSGTLVMAFGYGNATFGPPTTFSTGS
ncbi:unnamed protein product, partial [Rotaria sp. Silwood1]